MVCRRLAGCTQQQQQQPAFNLWPHDMFNESSKPPILIEAQVEQIAYLLIIGQSNLLALR